MESKNFFYVYIYILVSINTFIFAMEKPDASAKHPDILIEDLANLTDLDLEFKDSDQLELLLKQIDDEIQDPQNDFEGLFNVPEITDHISQLILNAYPGLNTKIEDLQRLKERILNILRDRGSGIGTRD